VAQFYLLAAWLWPIGLVALGFVSVSSAVTFEDMAVNLRLVSLFSILGLVPAFIALQKCRSTRKWQAVGAVAANLVTAGYGLWELVQ
jgi:hypothetical protein